jgi:hypothetical protein
LIVIIETAEGGNVYPGCRSPGRGCTGASALRRRARRSSCNRLHFFYNFVKTA